MTLPEPPKGKLGQEAVEAARERQESRMERRKATGLVAALFALPLMLAIGFFIGWGFFPPEAKSIPELAGELVVADRCAPVLVVNSADERELGTLTKAIADYEDQARASGATNVQHALFQQVIEGRIVFLVYYETCQQTEGQEVPTP